MLKGVINKLSTVIVLLPVMLLVGCASNAKKDVNKDIFQRALILQDVKPVVSQLKNKIEWQFLDQQITPNSTQKHELFIWFSTLIDYNKTPILLQLGPDWISSYKRGNVLREMIPRGIAIQQKYNDQLPKDMVIFSLNNEIQTSKNNQGGR